MAPGARKGAAGAASPSDPQATEAAAVLRSYEAKAAAELRDADKTLGVRIPVTGTGDPAGRVLLLKGEPAPADLGAGVAFAGPDGEAAAKAVEALGHDPAHAWMTCTRPVAGLAEAAYAERLRLVVEAVDPILVVALDPVAGADLAAASGVAALEQGRPLEVMGRTIGSTESLAASLPDMEAKARVWRQMRSIAAGAGGPVGAGTSGAANDKERERRQDAGRSVG